MVIETLPHDFLVLKLVKNVNISNTCHIRHASYTGCDMSNVVCFSCNGCNLKQILKLRSYRKE